MHEKRSGNRWAVREPVCFRYRTLAAEGELVNLSGTGALFRFDSRLPIGPEAVGQPVQFTSWGDVGALIRPEATVIRFFEDEGGKNLAVKFLDFEKKL